MERRERHARNERGLQKEVDWAAMKPTPDVVAIYLNMVRDMSAADRKSLTDFSKVCQRIYTVNDARCARQPSVADAPWPVLLLLGRYSKKYAFATRRPPRMDTEKVFGFTNQIMGGWR